MAKCENEGAYVPSMLMLGHHRARKVTIKSGAGVLGRGTVLGQVTADKKYLKSILAANDGSQVPDAILSEQVDASSADVEAIVYIAGEVDQEKLILGAGHTLGSVDAVFRTKSIWLVKPMG